MSKERKQQTVAIPLPKAKKNLVQIGCICIMLSVAMYGLVFSTLTAPILESVDAMGYVGLFSIFAALGISIMTPIGGKLGDLIGRRNIVVIPGIICIVCGVAFAFARSLVALMSLRLLISLAQGAFTAAPYIIMGLINERKDVPKAMGMLAAAVIRKFTDKDIRDYDIHVNVVGGGKIDGPSAGAAITMCVISALLDKPLRQDIALTGEISLRGKVKPVGGIFEKIYGARRKEIKLVLVPKDNENEIPKGLKDIEVRAVGDIEELLSIVF